MKFEEWEPIYREILEYFGFDRAADEEAARTLASMMIRDDLSLLKDRITGNQVTVCGNAPCLRGETEGISGVVIAADAAATFLWEKGIFPSAVFTDLDGATEEFVSMNRQGSVIVIHAHGDNIPLLKVWVRRFPGPVVATTQAAPIPGVYNFGGFTDGDRAAYAAVSLGASEVRFAGFDLSDTRVDPLKRGKLIWARRLLGDIGYTV